MFTYNTMKDLKEMFATLNTLTGGDWDCFEWCGQTPRYSITDHSTGQDFTIRSQDRFTWDEMWMIVLTMIQTAELIAA